MPAPTTCPEFLDFIRKSGLVQPERLDAFLRRYAGSDEEPSKIALGLIQEGLLTNFQARQLLRGRYRGFAIGKYLLLEQLGEGGMGKVFLCEHMLMRRRVAIKVLARELAADPGTIERFQREARAVASLDHPNIVRAHDVDCEGENHFIVMEYVDGASLHEIVRKKGPMEIDRACEYIKQAAVGLQAVADAGMIHRDVKPGNLLVDRKGVIKVLDLGLARFDQDKRDAITQRFDEGSVLGTADYLSPEQAMNSHEVDIRADIYSLGATFYFLLSGRPPFEGGTVAQKLVAHQLKEPEPIKKLRPDLPDELVAIVEKMMAKDLGRRYQKPQEVVDALQPFTRNPVAPPSEDEMPRLCLAAQRAGTPEAGPLPNLPSATSASMAASSFSRSNLSAAETPRSMSNTSLGHSRAPQQPARPQLDPRLSGSRLDKTSSSVVLMGGMQSGVTSPSRVGLGESSSRLNRAGTSSSSLRGRSSRITRRKRSRWPLYAGLTLGLLLLAMGGWWFFSGGKGKGDQELIVSRTLKGPNVYRTINEAWAKRDPERPGRILVRETNIEEHVRLVSAPNPKAPLWVIEGNASEAPNAPAQPASSSPATSLSASQIVVWKPLDATSDRPLLHIENVANLQISNFRFQAGSRTNDIMVVAGNCPRLTTRSLSFYGCRRSGLCVLGGSAEAFPANLKLSEMTFFPAPNAECGVLLSNSNQFKDPQRNVGLYNMTFNEDRGQKARFRAGIQISSVTEDLRIEFCNFNQCEAGILFRKIDRPFQPFNVTLTNSTFRDNGVGVRFESLERNDRNSLALDRLRFLGVGRLASVDDLPDPIVAGRWIWYPEASSATQGAPEGKRYFRHRFKVSNPGRRAYLDLACDDSCTVYLNGRKVKTIPPTSIAAGRAESIEITRDLRDGDNLIAIEAENLAAAPPPAPAGSTAPKAAPRPTPAGLIGQISGEGSDGMPLAITDGSWLCSTQAGQGWFESEFNDRSWKKAAVLGEHGQANLPWRSLTWDMEVRSRFGRAYTPVVKTNEVVRDVASAESFPNLGSIGKGREEVLAMVTSRGSSGSSSSSSTTSFSRTTPGVEMPTYLVAGPFEGGLDDVQPPEGNASPEMSYVGRDNKPVNWERVEFGASTNKSVDFGARYGKEPGSAYALFWLVAGNNQDIELHIHADDAVKVWQDEREIFQRNSVQGLRDKADTVKVRLKKGPNKFLVKVTNLQGDSGLLIKISGQKDVRYSFRDPNTRNGSEDAKPDE